VRAYYEQDGITIYHGDCRELLPSLAADVVVTDPPYGHGGTPKRGGGTAGTLDYTHCPRGTRERVIVTLGTDLGAVVALARASPDCLASLLTSPSGQLPRARLPCSRPNAG